MKASSPHWQFALVIVALLGGLASCRPTPPALTPVSSPANATHTLAPSATLAAPTSEQGDVGAGRQPSPATPATPGVPTDTPAPTPAHTATYAPGALPVVAQAAADNGDWERSVALWQSAIAEAAVAERGALQVSLARTLVQAGRSAEAIAPLQAALSGALTEAAAADAWGLLGSVYESRADWQAALDAFAQHLALDPSAEPYVRWHMARCYAALDDTEGQLGQLAAVVRTDLPGATQAEILEEQAAALLALERYDDALASWDGVLAVATLPDYVALVREKRAETLAAAGRDNEAAALWLAVALERPSSSAAALSLAALDHMGAGKSLTAVERGEILYHAGDYDAALDALQEHVESGADGQDRAHYYVGLCRTRLAQYPAAYTAFDAVIDDYPDSPLLADAWFAKARAAQAAGGDPAGLYSEFAVRYAEHARAPEAVWLAATALEQAGDWVEAGRAYQRLRTRYPQTSRAPEAWYREGLAAYAQGNKPAAYAVWTEVLAASTSAGERARLQTWLGLAAPSVGEAQTHWQAGAEAAPETYYGLRARDLAAGVRPLLSAQVHTQVPANGLSEADWAQLGEWIDGWATPEQKQAVPDLAQRTQRVHTLLRLEWRGQALGEMALLRQTARDLPSALLNLARAAVDEQLHGEGIQAAERILYLARVAQAGDPPDALLRLAYPTPYGELISAQAATYSVDALLFLALVRQESRFDARAVSYAGATGLTQVMPATGVEIAGRLDDVDYRQEMLTRPMVSVRYGVWYLSWLLDLCERDWVAALISYNAGYGRMRGWAGDGPIADHDLLYETMTVEQPRSYVRRIYEGYAMYQSLYAH